MRARWATAPQCYLTIWQSVKYKNVLTLRAAGGSSHNLAVSSVFEVEVLSKAK